MSQLLLEALGSVELGMTPDDAPLINEKKNAQ